MTDSATKTAASSFDYQDLVAQKKDYGAEVAYLESLMQSHAPTASTVLDIGCGTGPHAVLLAERGYCVCGVDLNERFIETARQRLAASAAGVQAKLSFQHLDARCLNLGRQFGVVTAMWNVLGYMVINQDVVGMLSSVSRHLAATGVFICDCWYGPAFLSSSPRVRVRKGGRGNLSYVHLAEPALVSEANRLDVDYTLLVRDTETSSCQEFHDKASYRYFFLPELEGFLDMAGLELVSIQGFMTDKAPSLDTRELCLVARKKS